MKKGMYEYLLENEPRHWWHRGKYSCAVRLVKKYSKHDAVLLELGASFGTFSRFCSPFSNPVALDISFDVLKSGRFLPSVCSDAVQLPFKDESFDFVVALDLLEHLNEDFICFNELSRVLKVGGRVFILVPAYPILWSDMDESDHVRRYTPKRLLELLSFNPQMKIIKFSHFNFFLFTPILIVRVIQRFLKRGFKNISTESMGIPISPVNYILTKLFLMEAFLVSKINFPIGVSLLVIAEKGFKDTE